jgi:hypothetical protein
MAPVAPEGASGHFVGHYFDFSYSVRRGGRHSFSIPQCPNAFFECEYYFIE